MDCGGRGPRAGISQSADVGASQVCSGRAARDRKGFFNVWGIHFDPVKGKPQGEPFQMTHFDGPS